VALAAPRIATTRTSLTPPACHHTNVCVCVCLAVRALAPRRAAGPSRSSCPRCRA
jgi:hypothetical protein